MGLRAGGDGTFSPGQRHSASSHPASRLFIQLGCPEGQLGASTAFLPFVVVQMLSRVRLFVTPWNAARQASLTSTISQSLLKLMSIESVMPSNHLILCRPLLLLPSVLPSIRVFTKESALHIRWPKYWSFSFSISPFNEY